MEKAIQDAVDATEKFEKSITALLASPRYNGNLLVINSHIRLIKNKLGFMGGILSGPARKKIPRTEAKHQPITRFMGHEIEVKKPETSSEVKRSLTPDQAAKDIFKKKVANLMSEIQKFPPQSVLTNYRRPEDIFIVRGAGRLAGMVDYDEPRPVDLAYVTELIAAIAKKKEDGTLQAIIDKAAADDKRITKQKSDEAESQAGKPKERSVILTAEDIATDEWLQKKGAQPGDQLVWDNNRHKKIIPGGVSGIEGHKDPSGEKGTPGEPAKGNAKKEK